MKGKVTVQIGKIKHTVDIAGNDVSWKEILETCISLTKAHTTGVREVDMVDHLISLHGITEKRAKNLLAQLTQAAQESTAASSPEQPPQKDE